MEQQKSKWKTWHKVVIGVCVSLFILIALIPKTETIEPKPVLKQLTKEDSATLRKKKIKDCFSAWDGAPIKLKEYVKNAMNDASSFEHVDSKYWDRDSFLVIKMEYRGKNGFGALVKETIMAKCNLDGTVIKIMATE
jgi:hypothetical protein